jgi:SAM-dependent methyltransferase
MSVRSKNKMTKVEDRYKKRCEARDTPWDIGKPDFNLVETVTTSAIPPCKALDIGCGTGDNSIWLAQKNFIVTGIDTSKIAIEKAIEKASKANVKCTFTVIDFVKNKIEGAPFGFAFDRGCFHSFDSDEERKSFAENVAAHLEKDGLWLSLLGNADEQRDGPGPPQRTAREIVNSVEPYFEILSLVSSYFGSNRPNPPKAWVCLMRKRQFP